MITRRSQHALLCIQLGRSFSVRPMDFIKNRISLYAAVLIFVLSLSALAQDKAKDKQTGPAPAAQVSGPKALSPEPSKPVDHGASYYHAAMARLYEEMASMYGRAEYVNKAIEEYRSAIAADPSSEYLNAALAELYSRSGRIRDAVVEAQDILQRDPNNLEAHRLLGRIYLHSLGDSQGQSSEIQSQEVLKLAIEQYEALARLEPKNPENHLMLGGLFIVSRELGKAESELKSALQADPTSEDGVTQLARLYNEEGNSKLAIETLNALPESARTSKIYATLGATYEQQKDYRQAVSSYQRAVALDANRIVRAADAYRLEVPTVS